MSHGWNKNQSKKDVSRSMSTYELWTAVSALTDRWVESEPVRVVREELSKDLDSGEALTGLRTLAFQAPQDIRRMPLAVYKAFPHMGFDLSPRDLRFMSNSAALDNAVCALTWAVRSVLPGYPTMPAPQLARGSYHTMDNFSPPWSREIMGAGVQYENVAQRIDTLLGIRGNGTVSRLQAAFQALPSWTVFDTRHKVLIPDVRTELLAARRTITEQTNAQNSSEEIDPGDPYTPLNRARQTTETVVASLSGDAQDYANAFGSVTEEIDRVVAGILPQLVAFGPPETLTTARDLEIFVTQPPTVAFKLHDNEFAQKGQLYWTNDSVIVDALYVEAAHMAHDNVHDLRFQFEATVLTGTSAAWR
jgi:hypothetical protein